MDKYSLEAFERYPMVRCRPAEEPDTDAAQFVFRTQSCPEEPLSERTLLEVAPESLERMAALRSLSQVLGFTVKAGAGDTDFLAEAVRAFEGVRFFAPVRDRAQVQWAKEQGVLGGLLIEIGENPYDACECMARQGLQKMYREVPVLVRGGNGTQGEAFAEQWHASMVESLAGTCAGWRIALRRITYPKAVSTGGFAPMRFWWTNRGPAFLHEKTRVRLRLTRGQERTDLPLGDLPEKIALGDRVYNEIVRLPDIAPGTYALEFGLFTETGEGLRLCHSGRMQDGFYPAGEICVDDVPRPEYEKIWDGYYADGYYPLWDPPVPGT